MTDGTAAIGTIHFALIALLAILAVIGIIWGVRAKHRRVQGRKEFEANAEAVHGKEVRGGEAHGEDAVAERALANSQVPPPAPVPIAPPPPPLADQRTVSPSPLSDQPQETKPLASEPVAAAIVREETDVTVAADAMVAEASPPGDAPLTQIKGLGPKVAGRMAELGIDRVGQLAALDDAGVQDLDARMGPFTGRIVRDRWIEQARLLTAGDREGFERAFGKLG